MRRRLTIAIVGVAAFAVVLFALPLALVLRESYRDQELLRLQRDTVAAARQIDVSADPSDPIEIPGGDDLVAVYDRQGIRLAGRGPAHADGLVLATIADRRPSNGVSNGALVVAVPLLTGERVTGAMRAERSDAAVRDRVNRSWRQLTVAAAAVILLAAVAALFLARRLARPLEQVVIAARRLGDGDFSVRAPRSTIREVDEVADAIERTTRRLEDLVSRERTFTANASHQLRTPLAAIRLELELMQLETPSSPQELERALEQVDRLEQTITTLLRVARDMPTGNEISDLQAVVTNAQERWHEQFAKNGRRLVADGLDGAAPARASRRVLDEILDVLLDNALRHGNGTTRLSLRDDSESWWRVEVIDQGTGFLDPPESAFQRREQSETGHGIGLALASSLAHAEGGRLELMRTKPTTLALTLARGDRSKIHES